MYKIFYSMKENPFDNTIDPDIFFPSPNHKQALNFILEELNSNETYILVVGENGIGKTLICNCLVDHLKKEENVSLVVMPSPGYSYRNVLKLILDKIDPSFEFRSVEEAQDRILDYIINKKGSKNVIIILDDAQDMDLASTLPKILSLGKIAVLDKPCLKFVIFGHLNFLKMLVYPDMETYNQRIRKRYTIEPLDFKQTREYVYYRLVKAGAPGIPRFDDKAIVLIYEYSRGIPRLINNVCDMALRIGADTKSLVIDSNIITKAISLLSPVQNILVDEKEKGSIDGDIRKDVITDGELVVTPVKCTSSDYQTSREDKESNIPTSASFSNTDITKIRLKSNVVFFLVMLLLIIMLVAVFYYNFFRKE